MIHILYSLGIFEICIFSHGLIVYHDYKLIRHSVKEGCYGLNDGFFYCFDGVLGWKRKHSDKDQGTAFEDPEGDQDIPGTG